MNGTLLRFYTHENAQHGGRLVWDALVKHANKKGVRGCSVFKAVAGFGSHHAIHEAPRAFRLNATQSIKVEFLVTDSEATELIDWARRENFHLFYTASPAQFETLNPDGAP